MPKVELVESKPEYAELWFKWRGEPQSLRFNPLAETTLEGLRTRMREMKSDLSDLRAAEVFQFFLYAEDQLVGTVSLKNISHMMMYAEIGYGVSEAHHGRGIGAAGVRAFVEKVFAETALRRLFAYVAEGNIASRRLLEKIGFVQEGLCREHYIINDVPTNEVMYGLLRSDLRD